MKKILLSLAVFFTSGVYVAYQYLGGGSSATASNEQTSASVAVAPSPSPAQTPPTTASSQPAPSAPSTPVQTPAPAPATKQKGQYTDGTYTGSPADAYYGTIQVQATISGGKLTDVVFLQYPSDRRTSQYINSQAMPLLKSEAIAAQSANVSGVSGATDSSQAFIQSLGSALAQAKV